LSDIDSLKRLNERLQKSKEFTEDIIDTVREPLAVLAKDLKVLYVNPSFLKNFKVNRWEVEGKPLYGLGNEQWNIPKLRAALEEVISKNAPLFDFEVEHDFPGLGTKTMLLNAQHIIDGHSDEPMMLLAIEDVTERKRVEAVRARLAAIVDSSDDAIIGKDPDGLITSWNAGAEHLFGYRPEEAIGRPITIIIPLDRHHEDPDILARLRRGERIERFETVRTTKHGQRLAVSLTVSPIQDGSGRTTATQLTFNWNSRPSS
jgi:PAS domain S-box-containing protein